MKKISLCAMCVAISGIWLVLSAGVAWSFISREIYLMPIALLMGGTVVGIAYRSGSKKTIVFLGMPIAYFLVSNLNKSLVVIELILMVIISYLSFIKFRNDKIADEPKSVHEIEEQMKNCC